MKILQILKYMLDNAITPFQNQDEYNFIVVFLEGN